MEAIHYYSKLEETIAEGWLKETLINYSGVNTSHDGHCQAPHVKTRLRRTIRLKHCIHSPPWSFFLGWNSASNVFFFVALAPRALRRSVVDGPGARPVS